MTNVLSVFFKKRFRSDFFFGFVVLVSTISILIYGYDKN